MKQQLKDLKKKFLRTFGSALRYKVLLVAILFAIGTGFTLQQVNQITQMEISEIEREEKIAELSSQAVKFNPEAIAEIESRLQERIDINPENTGTGGNPFTFDEN